MRLGIQFPGVRLKPSQGHAKQITFNKPLNVLRAGEVIPPSSYFFRQMSQLIGDGDGSLGETLQRRLPIGLGGM